MRRSLLALAAMCAVAHAQQKPCEPCVRGDDTLSQLGSVGVALRTNMSLLNNSRESGQWSDADKRRYEATFGPPDGDVGAKLNTLSDTQMTEVAAALCTQPEGTCVTNVVANLNCIAGRCRVIPQIQDEMVRPYDPPGLPNCDPTANSSKSSAKGIGFEWATGWQDDAAPTDHRAWSFGFEGRTRLANRIGLVGRVDRSTGRDKATDADRDGIDDVGTGPVTRLSVMGGPSYTLTVAHDKDIVRFLQVDVLGGYMWTLSKDSEDGLAAGADLSYTLAVARIGMRYVQGFGDASDSRAVLAHVGFLVGSAPRVDWGSGCGNEPSRTPTKLALALDIPLFGYGLSKQLDYVVPGFGIEALYHVTPSFDGFVHGDIIDIPRIGDGDRAIYQTLLAGARIDLASRDGEHGTKTGVFSTLGAGYSFAATTDPSSAGSGPVAEAAIGWGGQGDDGAAYLKLHARFGLTPDNEDMRVLFLSGGLELRLDRRKWRDRMGGKND
jgi:hypothetical protein